MAERGSNHDKQVMGLFDRKAASWALKYAVDGALVRRLEQFVGRAAELCPPPSSVLDFGCGTGELAAAMARAGHRVVACDISDQMLAEGERRHTGEQIQWKHLIPQWSSLPWPGGSFDLVVASSVFEYVEDLAHTAGECSRILRGGGWLLASVPNPRHRLRRIERVARLLTGTLPLVTVRVFSSRGADWLSYLRLSRNRFTLGEWGTRFERAGLRSQTLAAANEPLVLLALRKP